MRATILLGLGVFLLFTTSQAQAEEPQGRLARYGRLKHVERGEVRYGRAYYGLKSGVRGKKGRKYARRFSLGANLTGDKLEVFDEYGYTPHRLGYNYAGQHFERWRYHSEGIEFVFKYDELVKTRHFPAESNHID